VSQSAGLPGLGSDVSSSKPKVSFAFIALGFIIILCAALRFYHIGAASLWTDEIISRYYAQVFDLHYQFTAGLLAEPTPPTYALLLRAWMALFGYSEAAMRSLSTLACLLCVPVIYLLGRELAGKWQGLLAALLFALCPTSLYFGQEARVYALFTLSASIVLWAVAVLLRDPRSVKAAVGYVLFATLCLYLHATGLLFIIACAGAVGLFWLTQGAPGRRQLLKWTALNVLVLLLAAPYLFYTILASRTGGLDWMPPFSIHELVTCISAVIGGLVTPRPWPGTFLAAALLVTLVISLYLRPLSMPANVTLLGVPFLFVLFAAVLSLHRPILLPRILAWTVVPLCLIAGSQLLAAGRARFAVLICLVATFGTGLYFQVTTPGSEKEPWREAVHAFAPELERADLVVVGPLSDPMVLNYYAPQVKNVRLWDASLRPTIMNAAAERLHIAPITEPEILQAIAAKHSVWVLSNGFDLVRVNDLQSHTPATIFREWPCGKSPCVGLAGWQPR
jgi:4-amino-4-deoxy-L-arabinose transferase-like glycosyltransferase